MLCLPLATMFIDNVDCLDYGMPIVGIFCLSGAPASAKFDNKCEIAEFSKIVGAVLTILGIATISIKVP